MCVISCHFSCILSGVIGERQHTALCGFRTGWGLLQSVAVFGPMFGHTGAAASQVGAKNVSFGVFIFAFCCAILEQKKMSLSRQDQFEG